VCPTCIEHVCKVYVEEEEGEAGQNDKQRGEDEEGDWGGEDAKDEREDYSDNADKDDRPCAVHWYSLAIQTGAVIVAHDEETPWRRAELATPHHVLKVGPDSDMPNQKSFRIRAIRLLSSTDGLPTSSQDPVHSGRLLHRRCRRLYSGMPSLLLVGHSLIAFSRSQSPTPQRSPRPVCNSRVNSRRLVR